MATIPFTGMPLQFKKMYAGPLTDDQIFESVEAAEAWAASASGYPGAPITVKRLDEEGNETWSLFLVQEDKTVTMAAGDVTKEEIETQIQTIVSEMSEVKTEVESIKTQVESATTVADEAKTKAEEAVTKVEQVNTTVEQHAADITEVKGKVEKFEADTTEIKNDIETNTQNIATNTEAIRELKTAITWQEIYSE